MKILCIGDTYGDPGRKAIERFIPEMKAKGEVDFVICNAENASDGSGITESIAKDLFKTGCDVLTCGDHVWDRKKDIENMLQTDARLVRPANFPKGNPGYGSTVVECKGIKIGVIHIAGQAFMRYHFNSPFLSVDEEILNVKKKDAQIIIVDMHCEATSEKMGMGWYVDGRVAAVVGTHTHVQTADEKVTDAGTAYLTDLGMTGPYDSIIGAQKDEILKRFLTQTPTRKKPATGDVKLCGAIITVDHITGRATAIERVQRKLLN